MECTIDLARPINYCTTTLIVGPKGMPPVVVWLLEDRTTGRITTLSDGGTGTNVELLVKGVLDPWHTYTLSAKDGAAFTIDGGIYTEITFTTFKAFDDIGVLLAASTETLKKS